MCTDLANWKRVKCCSTVQNLFGAFLRKSVALLHQYRVHGQRQFTRTMTPLTHCSSGLRNTVEKR